MLEGPTIFCLRSQIMVEILTETFLVACAIQLKTYCPLCKIKRNIKCQKSEPKQGTNNFAGF